MADLKTDYKDDVLDTSKNEKRKYNLIPNEDGTVSLEDVTEYTQVGDSFGAADINKTNTAVNQVNADLPKLNDIGSTVTLPFTAPKDGFLTVYGDPTSDGLFFNYLTIKHDNNKVIPLREGYYTISGYSTYAYMHTIPLKKGDVVSQSSIGGVISSWKYCFR